MPHPSTLTQGILTKRIPCWPFADPKGRHIVGWDEYTATGGHVGLRKALAMKPDEVTEEVKKSQLRGRGGAGFPCGLKWTFLPKVTVDASGKESDAGQRYLAVNADESEPCTFKDRLLMDFDPHLMLEGIAIACYACRIKTAFVFIRGEYHHQAHVVENGDPFDLLLDDPNVPEAMKGHIRESQKKLKQALPEPSSNDGAGR